MDINDLTFVKSSLGAMRPADWPTVADQSGVPLGTLRKIAYGEVSDPRFWTIKKLADHFRSDQSTPIPGRPIDGSTVRETTGGTRRVLDYEDRKK